MQGVLIIKYVKDSGAMKTKSHVNKIYFLKYQLTTLTLSVLICWIPADIIYIVTFFLPEYSLELIKWTVIGIAPINSIIYPLVFSILPLKGT